VVDRDNPPSKPLALRGPATIGEYLRDVCGRDMTHRLTHIVADAERAAFLQSCTYPDETRVLYTAVLELRAGHIVRQTGVQAWDA
jgi:SnoaL-like domain